MATKTLKTQIGLRRDTEASYELVKDTLIPLKGEVCLVDTDQGLKMKVGDGVSTWGQLQYWASPAKVEDENLFLGGVLVGGETNSIAIDLQEDY